MSSFEIFELVMMYTMAGTLAVWTVLGIFALIIASFIWKSRFGLFTTGFVQVFLVAVNTYLISKEKYIAVFFVGGLISFVWTWNVQKIAFGTLRDRITYASGAGFGSLIGLLLTAFTLKTFSL
ncbi:hypothetical protein [Leptospira interrogans]|uniref:hypothetical protein n=1 Tax=Leptospira interrogans TaxID=173 RepID=UPI0002980D2B|nr:hypothetical protein [Leptospira interrogans]EKR82893.1 hypothetical protein LEP1GSC099_4346 [Leptospira interrogans str. UI 08452]EMN33960.1 hypothetical protein LEP1GSC084_1989 [Leptospira interrogans serovar Medanensis str. L0448]EMN40103.1 hypothetical protein LEP1GSC085_0801 [Leptospira interrogans str. L0996]EMN94645.1 hypothetical protein LEP1GSC110_0110 [Leptospira interrogans serovar Medanensis str. UT053]EMO95716.1 hypothetical protein LEP1GSC109_2249 [Leptospira interrogans str. 